MREAGDILNRNLNVSEYSFSPLTLKSLSEKFLRGTPFSYLLNESEFFHHKFFVNENVLIPRPETEHLVDLIVQKGKKFQKLLDVGTGSGVILLSLMKASVAKEGTGSDISKEALAVAEINRRRLRLNCQFLQSDRFQNISGKFDLIVSNPPYIKAHSHRSLVQGTVDSFEPHLALYLDDKDYDEWFQNFFMSVRDHLLPGGEFWMEGHEKELAAQAEVLKKLGFVNPQVIRDYSGLDRFLHAERAS
ncbi:MAG: peptide chain release factor N(5)-glutamine methyltransferase [Bdellovibrionota bacterium]